MKQEVKDPLTVSLHDFRDRVEKIARRGKLTLDLMQREDAPQTRINGEEQALRREVLDLRVRTTAAFGERLTTIIRDAGLG